MDQVLRDAEMPDDAGAARDCVTDNSVASCARFHSCRSLYGLHVRGYNLTKAFPDFGRLDRTLVAGFAPGCDRETGA